MTYLEQIGHEMTDKGGLLDKVLAQVPNVQAVYLSGSRLNHLNVAPTDYDLFIITKPTMKSIMTGQHYVHHATVEAMGQMADGKIYDTLKFLDVMVKTNPNTVELFYQAPLFVTSEFEPIAKRLQTTEMHRKMLAFNPTNFVHAVGGQVKQEGKSFQLGNVPLKRQTKIVVQTSKFERYFSELLTDGVLKSVLEPTEHERDLRRQSLSLEKRLDSKESSHVLDQLVSEFRHELLIEFEQIAQRIDKLVDQFHDGKFNIVQEKIDYADFKDFLMLP